MRTLPFALFVLPFNLLAQDPVFIHHTPRDQYLFPEEAPLAYVLKSGTPLHEGPGLTSAIVHTLATGTPISIEESTVDTLIMDGNTSHWYREKATTHEGWLWGGHIAQRTFGSTADPSVKFVGGIHHVTPSDTGRIDFAYAIAAIKAGRELDRIVVRSFAWSFEEVTNLGNRGLHSADDIITLNVPCVGGCGCTTGTVVVFWSGGRFHHVADLMGSPDGAYSTNVGFLFPADMEGLPGLIIRETLDYDDTLPEATGEEEEQPGGGSILRIIERAYLHWDGKALVPAGRMTDKRTYRLVVD